MVLVAVCALAARNPALGSYHFMQVEQVIGGVNGNTAAQAIQLRMRIDSQNQLENALLYAVDAAGENPVLLIDFATDVTGAAAGDRVLAVSEDFVRYTQPELQADYILTAAIPARYLAAGSLIFENDDETLLVWRLNWGGGGYTGDTIGALTNDDDREFGPPFAGPLPSEDLRALLFQGDFSDKSTFNNSDYALTEGAAVFTNNAGQEFTVTAIDCPNDPDNDADHDGVCGDVDNCPDAANGDQSDADEDGVGGACDACPEDASKSEPGVCGCGVADDDMDGDNTADCIDNCPELANPDQADRDEDGTGDACDGCPDDPGLIVAGFCEVTVDPDGGADGGAVGSDGDDDAGIAVGTAPSACGIGMIGFFTFGWFCLFRTRRGR